MTTAVGMVGIGLMGHGIARNVLGRGRFPLTILDHPGNQPIDDLIAAGARVAATAAEVAAASDVVILCVTGSPQVEAVLTGEGGVLQALRPSAVVVDCSTAMPDSTQRMADAVRAAGGRFLDAPMTRTAQHAHEGTLNLLVGGDAATLQEVRPVLESFTENITHVGAVGFGHRMKLLHNYVALGFMALLAEASASADLADVDPAVLVDVLAKGGGAGAALQRMAPSMVAGDPSAVPFSLDNALKDIGYFRVMAEGAGAPHAIVDGVLQTLAGAVAAGHGQAYVPDLVRVLKRRP
jgi:3-hydroxyisobutyrate dehydrogenase-like beta-hydroxyacid dehydrogenase